MYLGADTKEAAYTAFSKRANVLMLEGWELDPYGSSDTVFAVRRDRESRVLEVTECWDDACLAARPPSGLPEAAPDRSVALEPVVPPAPVAAPAPTNGHDHAAAAPSTAPPPVAPEFWAITDAERP